MEYTFNSTNFSSEVLNSDTPVMIDFYADWCAPCRMMSPAVKDLAEKYDGKIKIGKVNVDRNREIAARYGIQSIPNFVFIQNGRVVDQAVGAMPKFLLESRLKSLL